MTEEAGTKRRSYGIIAVIVLVIIAAGVGGVWWQRRSGLLAGKGPHAQDRFAGEKFAAKTLTLAPGVHMLGGLTPAAAYVVETDDGFLLIDAGLEDDAAPLARQIGELGLKLADLKAILLTHVHADHVFGARRLRELTEAKVYAGAADADVITAGEPREAFFSTFEMPGYQTHGTVVDIRLEGGEMIEVGGTKLEAIATPGHSPGSICYLLERGELRILFTGDTISSLVAELGTYTAYLPPRFRGDARDYLSTMKKLRAMPAPHVILPGHPLGTRIVHSPRPTEEQWYQVLDRGIRELERLNQRFTADGEDFLDGQPKELLADLHYLGDQQGRAVYAVADEGKQYVFDAPGDEGFAEFVLEGLKRAGIAEPKIEAVVLTSLDPTATGGLASMIERTGCAVIAPVTAHSQLRRMCKERTRFDKAEDVQKLGRYVAEALTLGGRGLAPTGWWLRDGERTVLISGQVPAPLGQASLSRLRDEARAELIETPMFLETLEFLRGRKPQMWLVAFPSNGQNANLYDEQWRAVLDANDRAVRGGF